MENDRAGTVCGWSCSCCDHQGNVRDARHPGGKPFWTAFVGATDCPPLFLLHNREKLLHCGHCPDLMWERFTRFWDPDMNEEETQRVLTEMVQNLRMRARDVKEGKPE